MLIPLLLFDTPAWAGKDEPVASESSHQDDDEVHQASPLPLHLGLDASLKPRVMAHAIANWLPFHRHYRWLGLNLSGRVAYAHEEGFYSTALGGPAFKLGQLKYWTLSPSAGFEKSEELWAFRTGLVITLTSDDLELAAVFEHGVATGPWYSTTINWWVAQAFGVGAFAQRWEGMGPWIGGRISHLSLGLAPVYDPETTDHGFIVTVELQRH